MPVTKNNGQCMSKLVSVRFCFSWLCKGWCITSKRNPVSGSNSPCVSLELWYTTCQRVFEWVPTTGAKTDDMKQVLTMAQLLMGTFKSASILPMPSCKVPFTAQKQTGLNFISCLELCNFDMSSVKHDPILQSDPIFLRTRKREEAKVISENS